MKKVMCSALMLVIFGSFTTVFSEDAQALPAFARKYKTSCMTCHAMFPRLTALGEAYRLNGYKMPEGDEIYIKDDPVKMAQLMIEAIEQKREALGIQEKQERVLYDMEMRRALEA